MTVHTGGCVAIPSAVGALTEEPSGWYAGVKLIDESTRVMGVTQTIYKLRYCDGDSKATCEAYLESSTLYPSVTGSCILATFPIDPTTACDAHWLYDQMHPSSPYLRFTTAQAPAPAGDAPPPPLVANNSTSPTLPPNVAGDGAPTLCAVAAAATAEDSRFAIRGMSAYVCLAFAAAGFVAGVVASRRGLQRLASLLHGRKALSDFDGQRTSTVQMTPMATLAVANA